MPTFPYTKAELTQRLRMVNAGMWDDVILVFADGREIHTRQVRKCLVGEQERAFVIGLDRSTNEDVEFDCDPRDVVRTIG